MHMIDSINDQDVHYMMGVTKKSHRSRRKPSFGNISGANKSPNNGDEVLKVKKYALYTYVNLIWFRNTELMWAMNMEFVFYL